MAPSFDWWSKENNRGTPVVVKMGNPNNWSMVELQSPFDNDFLLYFVDATSQDKAHNKNAKQG
ncbi:hypothetical protein CsSME_00041264 [Camellia sinensis var. sinensis]